MSKRWVIEAWAKPYEFGNRKCQHRETIAGSFAPAAAHLRQVILRDGTELEIKVRFMDWSSNFVPILQHQDLIKVAVLSGQPIYDQRLYPEGSESYAATDELRVPVRDHEAPDEGAAGGGEEGRTDEGTVRVEDASPSGEQAQPSASVPDQGSASMSEADQARLACRMIGNLWGELDMLPAIANSPLMMRLNRVFVDFINLREAMENKPAG